jgi:hypothetical protein
MKEPRLAPKLPFMSATLKLRGFLGPQRTGASVESHAIPATRRPKALGRRAKAGIRFLPDMDPRFRGGDVLTFISMGGLLTHDHSE